MDTPWKTKRIKTGEERKRPQSQAAEKFHWGKNALTQTRVHSLVTTAVYQPAVVQPSGRGNVQCVNIYAMCAAWWPITTRLGESNDIYQHPTARRAQRGRQKMAGSSSDRQLPLLSLLHDFMPLSTSPVPVPTLSLNRRENKRRESHLYIMNTNNI